MIIAARDSCHGDPLAGARSIHESSAGRPTAVAPSIRFAASADQRDVIRIGPDRARRTPQVLDGLVGDRARFDRDRVDPGAVITMG